MFATITRGIISQNVSLVLSCASNIHINPLVHTGIGSHYTFFPSYPYLLENLLTPDPANLFGILVLIGVVKHNTVSAVGPHDCGSGHDLRMWEKKDKKRNTIENCPSLYSLNATIQCRATWWIPPHPQETMPYKDKSAYKAGYNSTVAEIRA